MRIVLDCDGPCSDFVGATSAITGHDRSLAITWDWFRKHTNPDDTHKTLRTLSTPTFWENLPVVHGAMEGVDFLRNKGHAIAWATAPYRQCFGWGDIRRKWLEENFNISKHKEPLFTVDPLGSKHLIQGLVFIDDRYEEVQIYQKENPDSLALTFESEMNTHLGVTDTFNWEKIMALDIFQKDYSELEKYK